jgi:hypothetical protein
MKLFFIEPFGCCKTVATMVSITENIFPLMLQPKEANEIRGGERGEAK